jgi:protein SCO1/2
VPLRITPIIAMLALTTFAAACSSSARPAAPTPIPGYPRALVMLPPERISDFSLTDQNGRPFRLSETPGKVRIVYFGYTSCPDICPTTLWEWKTIKRELGQWADDVRFIMVTVDPGVDTPDALKRFVRLFDASFVGLTGTPDDVALAWEAFGVRTDVVELSGSYAGHTISHSTSMYVLDRDNLLRMKIPFAEEPEDAAQDIRLLLSRIP